MSTQATSSDQITIAKGEQQYHNDNHSPSKNTGTIWFRHDVVMLNGKEIGRIQVKERQINFGRLERRQIETVTICGDACVHGTQIDWLIRMHNLREQ